MSWNFVKVNKNTCPHRASHSANIINDEIYIYGGYNGTKVLRDMQCYDIEKKEWRKLKCTGKKPKELNCHASTISKNRIYIHGGHNGIEWVNNLYEFDTVRLQWIQLLGDNPPGERASHSLDTLPNNDLIIFGGYNGIRVLNDLHVFNIEKRLWTRISPEGAIPMQRNSHASTVFGTKLIIFAGDNGINLLNDMHIYETLNNTWTPVEYNLSIIPPKIRGHTLVTYENSLILFGGYASQEHHNSILVFDINSKKWIAPENIPFSKVPFRRSKHSFLLHKNECFMFGGFNGAHFQNDTWTINCEEIILKAKSKESQTSILEYVEKKLFNNPEHADVVFEIEEKKIYCHFSILSIHSMVFVEAYKKDNVEGRDKPLSIIIQEYSYAAFYSMIEYLYKSQLNYENNTNLLNEILKLSINYKLDLLKSIILLEYQKHYKVDSICGILMLAEKCKQEELIQSAMEYLKDHIELIKKEKDYKTLVEIPLFSHIAQKKKKLFIKKI